MKRALGVLAIIICVSYTLSASVFAEEPAGAQISPVRQTLKTTAGSIKTGTVTVKNVGDAQDIFTVSFVNFKTSDTESGEPQIIADAAYPDGIMTWLSGPNSITIGAGQQKQYTFSINVPKATKDGTYYGALKFSGAKSPQSSFASMVFVDVGTVTHQVAIEELSKNDAKVDSGGNARGSIIARIKNTGTGYTTVAAKLQIVANSGSVVKEYDLNPDNGGILPGAVRKFTQNLSDLQLSPGAGYKMRLSVNVPSGEPINSESELFALVSGEPSAKEREELNKKTNPLPFIAAGITALLIIVGTVLYIIKKRRTASAVSASALSLPALQSSTEQEFDEDKGEIVSVRTETPTTDTNSTKVDESQPTEENENPSESE